MYTLKEITERWNKTENDILRMAIREEVVLSAWGEGYILFKGFGNILDGLSNLTSTRGLFDIEAGSVGAFLANPDSAVSLINFYSGEILSTVFGHLAKPIPEEKKHYPYSFIKVLPDEFAPDFDRRDFYEDDPFNYGDPIVVARDNLLVSFKNAAIAERKYPELAAGCAEKLGKTLETAVQDEIEKILDPDHAELARIDQPVMPGKVDGQKKTSPDDEAIVKQLLAQGLSKIDITRELLARFPGIKPSRVGRLVTSEPGITVTNDAFRKRGIRLIEKTKKNKTA
jgi:hypothetical protein